jgi:TolA-binding protein
MWGLDLREYPEGALRWYAHYDLGKLRAAAGDQTGAAAEYRKALQLSPEGSRVVEMLNALRAWEGSKEGAVPSEPPPELPPEKR